MKAETILAKYEYLVRVETDSSIIENPAIRAMKEYAQIQIKKDRERIKEYLGEGVLITQINKVINETPIILD
jgi:hypothetical protein